MPNWRTETGKYLQELTLLLALTEKGPPHPPSVPQGPLDTMPSELQRIVHRAVIYYENGILFRARETMNGVITLWREGNISAAAVLVRLLFELWAGCEYQTDAIDCYRNGKDIVKLNTVVNRLFEGVRYEVQLPWGKPASEKPIHVMDTIRKLEQISPGAMDLYEFLSESSHVNQPRYFEWRVIGCLGDNWKNEMVQDRGHVLLKKTLEAAKVSVEGIIGSSTIGLEKCGDMYKSA